MSTAILTSGIVSAPSRRPTKLPVSPAVAPTMSFGPLPIVTGDTLMSTIQQATPVNYEMPTFFENLRLRLSSHDFGRPQTITDTLRRESYPTGYDSHQTCVECGVQRFFDSKTFKSGPFFRRKVQSTSRSMQIASA